MFCKNCQFNSRQRKFHKCINERSEKYDQIINDDGSCGLYNTQSKTFFDLITPALPGDLGKLLIFVDNNGNIHEIANIDWEHDDIVVLKEK